MQADPQLQRRRIAAPSGGEVALYLERGSDGGNRAGEFDQEAVPCHSEQASVAFLDAPFEHNSQIRQALERCSFGSRHPGGVADHIGRHQGGETPCLGRSFHRGLSKPAASDAMAESPLEP
jgi:hypothetical protein